MFDLRDIFGDNASVSMVYIWSNGNPHSTLEEYGSCIDKTGFIDSCVHVVINTMVPLAVCPEKFQGQRVFSFHRTCSKRVNETCMHGFEQFGRFEKYCERSFLISRDSVSDITGLHDVERRSFSKALETAKRLCAAKVDGYGLYGGYPKKECGESTGFLCFLLLLSAFDKERITLCNFSVDDERFRRCTSIHGLEFEAKVYADEGIAMKRI